jgi:hypothetical protein
MKKQEDELPEVVPTHVAAEYINRRPQTLRKWSSQDSAPLGIRPIRINGRLAWRVIDLIRLLTYESNPIRGSPEEQVPTITSESFINNPLR